MFGVDELKTKRAPHVDLGRVLVHVAGIYAKKSNRCAGQEEKKEKANAPPQAFDHLHRWTPVNSVDVRCAHAAAPRAPSTGERVLEISSLQPGSQKATRRKRIGPRGVTSCDSRDTPANFLRCVTCKTR